jgi:hypothetical protein
VLANAQDAWPLLDAQRATLLLVPATAAAAGGRPAPAELDPARSRYTGRHRHATSVEVEPAKPATY